MFDLHLFIDSYFSKHQTGYGHPESSKRILALCEMVKTYNSHPNVSILGLDESQQVNPTLVHTVDYYNFLQKNIPLANTFLLLDEDTIACKESLDVALAGLKMMQQAVDCTFANKQPTFAMTRPPGHHAKADASMGFCIFNNVAYAAQYACRQYGVEKILILDWDVHHFNGTEEMFYEDGNTLTISLHQFPHWPEGYGWVDRRGDGEGVGFNLNIPLAQEAGDLQVIEMFQKFIIPQIQQFQPEFILISAGFDAHQLERKSGLGVPSLLALTDFGYSWMTHELNKLAQKYASGRFMLVLEGGYYLPSLVSGTQSVIQTLISGETSSNEKPTTGQNMDQNLWVEYVEALKIAIN